MNNSEKYEAPHKNMMQLPYVNISTQKWDNPGKEFWKKSITHCSIHAKAGKTLQKEDQKSDKINQARKGIMSY